VDKEIVKNPLYDALWGLTGARPPAYVRGLSCCQELGDHVLKLQDWCILHARPEWSTGIGLLEAAEHIVREAVANGNILGSLSLTRGLCSRCDQLERRRDEVLEKLRQEKYAEARLLIQEELKQEKPRFICAFTEFEDTVQVVQCSGAAPIHKHWRGRLVLFSPILWEGFEAFNVSAFLRSNEELLEQLLRGCLAHVHVRSLEILKGSLLAHAHNESTSVFNVRWDFSDAYR